MAKVASTLRTLVDGDDITTYKEGNEEYKVRLRLITEDRSSQWAIENLMIQSNRDIPGRDQFFVPLKQVARLQPRGGPTEIRRYDRRREVVISGNTPSGAAEVIAGELRKNPRIKAVLSTGQADTEGAGIAIGTHFPGQGYRSAGFDLSPEILHHIREGHIAFTIDQQPYIQGFYPVVQLALYHRYGIMPSSMDAGATLITRENADSVLDLARQNIR